MNFTLTLYGQSWTHNDHWLNACDSVIIQADLNSYTYREFEKADSLMTEVYNEIIIYLEEAISDINQTGHPDIEYMDWLTEKKTTVSFSQEQWIKMRNANSGIFNIQYEGGSMRSMAVNISATNDTYCRLEKLMEIRNLVKD